MTDKTQASGRDAIDAKAWRSVSPPDGGSMYWINDQTFETSFEAPAEMAEANTDAAEEEEEEEEESFPTTCGDIDEESESDDEARPGASPGGPAMLEASQRGRWSSPTVFNTASPPSGSPCPSPSRCPQWWSLFNWGSRHVSDADPRCQQVAFMNARTTGRGAFRKLTAAMESPSSLASPISARRRFVNRIPGMSDAVSKVYAASVLQGASFSPESWSLPEDLAYLEGAAQGAVAKGPLVLKPDRGQSGIGVEVVEGIEAALHQWHAHPQPAVLQRYIEPLLFQGKKWDLRLYVLVARVEPLEVYVCRSAWCGLCAEPWQHPNESSASGCHVASGNRRERVEFCDMLRWIEETHGFAIEDVWAQIDEMVAECMRGIAPKLKEESAACLQNNTLHCFQVLGLDLMFDVSGKVWLAEINSNPDMGAKDAIDLRVKHEVLQGALDIVVDGGAGVMYNYVPVHTS